MSRPLKNAPASQDIALIDARRGVTMFHNISVPVLGVVENMSFYACPACQHREYIFGRDGAKRTAAELGLDLLGEVCARAFACNMGFQGFMHEHKRISPPACGWAQLVPPPERQGPCGAGASQHQGQGDLRRWGAHCQQRCGQRGCCRVPWHSRPRPGEAAAGHSTEAPCVLCKLSCPQACS